jgi:hypothetical protein
MQITEPVTMLTDYVLGIANLLFAISTFRTLNSKNRVSGLLLLLGFIGVGIASIAGGTYHGFRATLDPANVRIVWNITTISIGCAIAFLASSIHSASVQRDSGQWLIAATAVAILSLLIQASGFRRHLDYNHNDLFHVVLLAAMYLFYKGARHLQDRAYSPR